MNMHNKKSITLQHEHKQYATTGPQVTTISLYTSPSLYTSLSLVLSISLSLSRYLSIFIFEAICISLSVFLDWFYFSQGKHPHDKGEQAWLQK